MFYPVFIDLRQRRVLVVGGGIVAERKVGALVDAQADVTLVAPDITPALRGLAESGIIRVMRRRFIEGDLDGVVLVISATDDPETQEHVVACARTRKILINTMDQPQLCDFIVPAVVRRGDVAIAISTSGKSPALAAALKGKIEGVVTDNVARAARVLGVIRGEVHDRIADPEARKEVFERIVASGIVDWIADYDDDAAIEKVRKMIEGAE